MGTTDEYTDAAVDNAAPTQNQRSWSPNLDFKDALNDRLAWEFRIRSVKRLFKDSVATPLKNLEQLDTTSGRPIDVVTQIAKTAELYDIEELKSLNAIEKRLSDKEKLDGGHSLAITALFELHLALDKIQLSVGKLDDISFTLTDNKYSLIVPLETILNKLYALLLPPSGPQTYLVTTHSKALPSITDFEAEGDGFYILSLAPRQANKPRNGVFLALHEFSHKICEYVRLPLPHSDSEPNPMTPTIAFESWAGEKLELYRTNAEELGEIPGMEAYDLGEHQDLNDIKSSYKTYTYADGSEEPYTYSPDDIISGIVTNHLVEYFCDALPVRLLGKENCEATLTALVDEFLSRAHNPPTFSHPENWRRMAFATSTAEKMGWRADNAPSNHRKFVRSIIRASAPPITAKEQKDLEKQYREQGRGFERFIAKPISEKSIGYHAWAQKIVTALLPEVNLMIKNCAEHIERSDSEACKELRDLAHNTL
ncbi:MAG: hypothetical protein HQL54_07385 [Magnetococcales bacterium]|nr:hypothetical protein [Magnetococcales bacterium]